MAQESPRPRRIRADEDVQKALAQAAPDEAESKPRRRAVRPALDRGLGSATSSSGACLLSMDQDVIQASRDSFNLVHRIPLAWSFLVVAALFLDRLIEHFGDRPAREPRRPLQPDRASCASSPRSLILGVVGADPLRQPLHGPRVPRRDLAHRRARRPDADDELHRLALHPRSRSRTGSGTASRSETRRATSSRSATSTRRSGSSAASTSRPTIRAAGSSSFPNSKVLNTAVYNYSWPLFPVHLERDQAADRLRERPRLRGRRP